MIKKLSNVCALFLATSLSLSGCAKADNSYDGPAVASGDELSNAYYAGYNGNLGLAPATIANAGGSQSYCESIVGLHPDFTATEVSDYIQGCLDVISAESSSDGSGQDSNSTSTDLLSRLRSVGGDTWGEDKINPIGAPTGFQTDYLAGGACTLWVFDSGNAAANAAEGGFLDSFTSYGYSWGTDSSGLGVIAMYEDQYSPCADDMLTTLGWGSWPE